MDVSDEMDKADDKDLASFDDFNSLSMDSESKGNGGWPSMEPIPMPMDPTLMPMDLENCEFRVVAKKFGDKHIKRKDLIKDVVRMHVLPFLPAKALFKFKSVSKEWDRWIGSPLLAHHQSFSFQKISGYFCDEEGGWIGCTEFFSLDSTAHGVPCPFLLFLPTGSKVLCSCNGLLLCQSSESYFVCNPTTKDWKILPYPGYYHGSDPAVVLAFEPSLQNIEVYYHVICAFYMLDSPVISFEIYSSATRSWTCSSVICTELGDSSLKGAGFYVNGNAYWETSSGQVLVFDVKNPGCGIISLPSEVAKEGTLTKVGDEICFVTVRYHCKSVFTIDIYGGLDMGLKRSISLNLTIPNFASHWEREAACKVLPGVDGDNLLILTGKGKLRLFCYRFSDQKTELLCRPHAVSFDSKFLPYINSLAFVS